MDEDSNNGEERFQPIAFIIDAITSAHYPNPIAATMYMRQHYEIAFDIYDHDADDDPDVPWPLLAKTIKESMKLTDPIDFRLDQHAENKVFELFGISFDDFIKRPRYDLLKIIESAKKHSARLVGAGSAELKKLEDLLKRQQQPPPKQ